MLSGDANMKNGASGYYGGGEWCPKGEVFCPRGLLACLLCCVVKLESGELLPDLGWDGHGVGVVVVRELGQCGYEASMQGRVLRWDMQGSRCRTLYGVGK